MTDAGQRQLGRGFVQQLGKADVGKSARSADAPPELLAVADTVCMISNL